MQMVFTNFNLAHRAYSLVPRVISLLVFWKILFERIKTFETPSSYYQIPGKTENSENLIQCISLRQS